MNNKIEKADAPIKKKTIDKLVIAVCVLIIVFSIAMGGITLYNNLLPPKTDSVVIIKDIFTDINGDGLDDYIGYAEVIFNKGDFTISP